MFRHVACAALLAGGALAGPAAACAESRLALVIGQSAYHAVTPLPNPANDAKAMAQLLTDSGFDVTSTADLSRKDMNKEVGDFAVAVRIDSEEDLIGCNPCRWLRPVGYSSRRPY